LLSNARTVVLIGFLGQLFAFARTAAMAYLFGTSVEIDAYNLALSLPIFLSSLVTGWLQASFVGAYIDVGENQSAQAARDYRSLAGLITLFLLTAFTIVLFAARQPLSSLLVPQHLGKTHDLTYSALALAPFILVPSAMSDFLALILSCHKRFLAASIAPILNAVVSIAALFAWPAGGLDSLLLSLIFGWLCQMGLLLVVLLRCGLGFVIPVAISLREVKALISLFLPILPAVLFSNGTNLILQSAFVRMGEGFVSTYGYAQRLNNALVQVIVVGLSSVLLPHLAGMLARSERHEIVILFDRIIKSVLAISFIAVVLVALYGADTILMLFGRGKFHQEQANLVNQLWIVLTVATAPFAISTFFAKLFQAVRQPGKLGVSSLISFCVTAATCQIGILTGSYLVIAGALGIAQLFVLAYFGLAFQRELSADLHISRYVSFVMFATALAVVPMSVEMSIRHFGLASQSSVSVLLRGSLFIAIFAAFALCFGLLKRISTETAP
jgi:putative peptidoglycan lipid II flippase